MISVTNGRLKAERHSLINNNLADGIDNVCKRSEDDEVKRFVVRRNQRTGI